MEMRRVDIWVGRLAAVAGLVYVVLCGLWPLNAAAGEAGVPFDRWRPMIVAPAAAPNPAFVTDGGAQSGVPAPLRSVVVLATLTTLVLFRRWHDPHASLDAYLDAASPASIARFR